MKRLLALLWVLVLASLVLTGWLYWKQNRLRWVADQVVSDLLQEARQGRFGLGAGDELHSFCVPQTDGWRLCGERLEMALYGQDPREVVVAAASLSHPMLSFEREERRNRSFILKKCVLLLSDTRPIGPRFRVADIANRVLWVYKDRFGEGGFQFLPDEPAELEEAIAEWKEWMRDHQHDPRFQSRRD